MMLGKNIVIIISILTFFVLPGALQVHAVSLSQQEVPSWIDVNMNNNIIILKIKPSYYLEEGIPVIVVESPDDVKYLADNGVSAIIDIGLSMVGETTSLTSYEYGGPGSIVAARVGLDNSLLLLTVGNIDLYSIKVNNKYAINSYNKIVIINSEFNSNICDLSISDRLSKVVNSTILKDVLVEVLCYPPIVAVDKTILEERGYTVHDIVKAFRSAGVDNFYLFLVSDYKKYLMNNMEYFDNGVPELEVEVDTSSNTQTINTNIVESGVERNGSESSGSLSYIVPGILAFLVLGLFAVARFT